MRLKGFLPGKELKETCMEKTFHYKLCKWSISLNTETKEEKKGNIFY